MPVRKGLAFFSEKNFRVFSLRTTSLRDAKTLANRLTRISDQVFAAMTEKTMPIAPELADRLLTDLARFEIECFERARAIAPQRCAQAAAFELQREAALQETLRHALLLRDREVCRKPLRHVAARLGLALDEEDQDWLSLAIQATQILLDVSEERARRDQGIYDGPSPVFRSAMAQMRREAQPRQLSAGPWTPPCDVQTASAQFASTHADAATVIPNPTPRPHAGQQATVSEATAAPSAPAQPVCAATETTRPAAGHAAASAYPALPPAHSPPPQGQAASPDKEDEITRRIAARPPKIGVNLDTLSDASCISLSKPRGITLREAYDLYVDIKRAGYGENFHKHQRRHQPTGVAWEKSSGSKLDVASRIWLDLLGDLPFEDIAVSDVEDALDLIWRIPRDHGKTEHLKATAGYRELIERVDASEIDAARAQVLRVSSRSNHTNADLEAAKLGAKVPRLRVDTYLKHCRTPNAIGKMLYAMQMIDTNPFEICSWTKAEADGLKRTQDCRARTSWDDRITKLFASPVYQGETEDPGDPLFWAPLIGRLQGLRMQESLQLGPKDFGTEDGIDYLWVRNTEGNNVKSEAGERRLPVHPDLIKLGFMKLVELRRRQSQTRLFPDLTRGSTKENFAENFSKAFGYYRKTHGCYWRGLDFHALRTSFHGDLLNQDRSDAIRRRLMGHAPQDEGEKSYAQGLKMAPLLERIREVSVDTSMIISPFEMPREETRYVDQERRQHLRVV
tara:strand:+ start:183 stop:2393 length:2211 start_codon:yes stop_codon:yes gene_type:complete